MKARLAALALAALVAGCGEEERPKAVAVTVEVAMARDPGGSERARVQLPSESKWFGFHGAAFLSTGRSDPRFDQGITARRTVIDALAAGANSARVQVGWGELEPEPGKIDSEYVRRISTLIDGFEAHDGRVLLVLGQPPRWSSQSPGDPTAAPRGDEAGVAAYARYAAFVATTWPHAAAIETWNEPNAAFFWRPGSPDPDLYARMHKAAATAIRDAVPEMPVLVAGLLTAHRELPEIVRPQRYLKQLYAAGLTPSDYDGLAIHPYPGQGGARVGPLDSGVFAAAIEDFRLGHAEVDPDARLWVTETGVTTSGPAAVDAAVQADAVARLLRKLLSNPRVQAVYLHTQYDVEAFPADNRERGFGLLLAQADRPGQPKPAFCALRQLVTAPPPFAGCP